MKDPAGKRVVIFTNGMVRNPDYYRNYLKESDIIVCANGGAAVIMDMEITPDVVIGDLDSLPSDYIKALEQKKVKIMKFPPEKDYSDLELAINYSIKLDPCEITILGALGGRIDQTFANLMLLNSALNKGILTSIADEAGEVRLINKETIIRGSKGDYLSLLPVTPEVKGVTTSGLKYPLKDETLLFSSTRGLSNEFTEEKAIIKIKSGLLLIIKIFTCKN